MYSIGKAIHFLQSARPAEYDSVVGAEGIEPSTSSASRKHSSTELRAFSIHKPVYINNLPIKCQYRCHPGDPPYFEEEGQSHDFAAAGLLLPRDRIVHGHYFGGRLGVGLGFFPFPGKGRPDLIFCQAGFCRRSIPLGISSPPRGFTKK